MDPHEPFLKAICAARHDDLPRLVYADFLEETGDPPHVARAHFIRTQINLEHEHPRTKLYEEMKSLEARILDYYLEDWRFELPDFVRFGSELDRVKWRRGFPDDLGPMSFAQFEEFGAPALSDLPLSAVHITERREGYPLSFERFPALASVSSLALTTCFPLALPPGEDKESSLTFDSLMTAPVFTSLRHLDLSENRITDAWVIQFCARFATASFAPTLETLDLSRNYHISNAGANVLATAPALERLKRLVVRDTGSSKIGLDMLKKRYGSRLG